MEGEVCISVFSLSFSGHLWRILWYNFHGKHFGIPPTRKSRENFGAMIGYTTNLHDFTGHLRYLNWRYLPYVRLIFQAYVREYHQKIWPYMVLTYLHFRILKFPLTEWPKWVMSSASRCKPGLETRLLGTANRWCTTAWCWVVSDLFLRSSDSAYGL